MEQKECCSMCNPPNCSRCEGERCHASGCECHTSQNSGEVIKSFRQKFPQLYNGYPEGTFTKRIEEFIQTEIDRAERRVREELREKIDNLKITVDEILPSDSVTVIGQLSRNKALRDVLNLL